MSNLRTIKKRASIPAALVAILAMVMSIVLVPFQEATAQTTGERDKFFGTCGGSVAISFDLSNSLSPTDVENSQKAARKLVESLKAHPTDSASTPLLLSRQQQAMKTTKS